MSGIEFGLSAQVFVVLLAIAFAAVIVILYYRRTLPVIPLRRKLPLIVLRLITLCTLALLIFQPLLRLIISSRDRPVCAVLVDNSKSMRLVDGVGSRASVLRTLLAGPDLRLPRSRAQMEYYTFGVHPGTAPGLPDDTLRLNDDATDIAAAVRELATEKEHLNLRAAVLLSDGVYTLGQNPLYDAERLGIPFYTVGIGDSSEQKDVSVDRVTTNDIAFSDVRTPVEVTIRSSGFGGEHLQVTLLGAGKELDRAPLLLQEGSREYIVHLSYIPEGEGEKRLSVTIPVLPQEVTEKNNRRAFTVRVLKSNLHVLILAGSPGPDLSILRQTVAEQPNLSVRTFAQKPGGGFYEGEVSRAVVDSTDCLMLVDMLTASTQQSTADLIGHLLGERNIPLLYVGGREVDASRLTVIQEGLPFTFAQAGTMEETISATPEPSQRGNPLLDLGSEVTFESWTRLPPVYRTIGTYKTAPGASVLVSCTPSQNLPGGPLILTRAAGNRKSLAITGYGIWRWRLMAQGDPATEQLLPAFMHAAIRWLTTPEDLRRFSVAPTQGMYPVGEAASFTGRLFSATGQTLDDARVRIVLHSVNQVAESDLRSLGDGRYGGSIEGLGEGVYSYRGTAEWHGGTVGVDTGSFTVGGMDLEFRETRMNIGLLRQLAFRTGGAYFSPAELPRLDSALRAQTTFVPVQVRNTIDVELWNLRYLLAVLIALFAAEWVLRKWHGML